MKFEVRVPTYRRPDLLGRALRGLIAQTHQNWVAIVLDDSPGREAESVVGDLSDRRIIYQPNAVNLGQIRNINQAFSPEPFTQEATIGAVLEDDNQWDPEWLEQSAKDFDHTGAKVIVRNYGVVRVDQQGRELQEEDRPMELNWGSCSKWLPIKDRVVEGFFSFGCGNFSYLWEFSDSLDISCSSEVHNVHVAECRRAFAYAEDIWFASRSLGWFTRFVDKGLTPPGETRWDRNSLRKRDRSEIRYFRELLRWVGRRPDRREIMSEIWQRADELGRTKELARTLAKAGSVGAWMRLRDPQSVMQAGKGLLNGLLPLRKE